MSDFNFKSEKLRQMVEFLVEHPKEYTVYELAEMFSISPDQVYAGIRRAKSKYNLEVKQGKANKFVGKKRAEYIPPPPNTENILIIGDVHVPFDVQGYLEFCQEQYRKWKCTHVIFTGDVVDFYAFSRFDHDPDAMSPGEELDETKQSIQRWYKAFPKADVLVGNHENRIAKRAFGAGLPRRLLISLQDLLDVPGWNYRHEFLYDGIRYIHGDAGSADRKASKDWVSTVQGHIHTEAFVKWIQGESSRIFAMQIGCGVDTKSYAFDYAKFHRRPAIGVGVILSNGKLPINILM